MKAGFTPAQRAALFDCLKSLENMKCPFVDLPTRQNITLGRGCHRRRHEEAEMGQA